MNYRELICFFAGQVKKEDKYLWDVSEIYDVVIHSWHLYKQSGAICPLRAFFSVQLVDKSGRVIARISARVFSQCIKTRVITLLRLPRINLVFPLSIFPRVHKGGPPLEISMENSPKCKCFSTRHTSRKNLLPLYFKSFILFCSLSREKKCKLIFHHFNPFYIYCVSNAAI